MRLFSKKKKNQIKMRYSPQGIKVLFEGEKVPVFPLNKNQPDILASLLLEGEKWSALENLWEEELIQSIDDNNWIISYDIYKKLNPNEDQEIFDAINIPIPENLPIELKTNSHVGDYNFKITAKAYHDEVGQLTEKDYPRYGQVFYLNEDKIIPLTISQAAVFEAAQDRQDAWNLEDRTQYLAKTKMLAQQVDAKIDKYLQTENYEFKTDIGLDLKEEDTGDLTLIPSIKDVKISEYGVDDPQSLIEDSPPFILTKPGEGNIRDRIVIDKKTRQNLSYLPKRGKITGQNIPRLLTTPEQIIPEGFDLSLFSKRVKGIRTKVYNSRPYLHVNKSPGGWFDGIPMIKIDDWSPGEENEKGQETQLSPETLKKLALKVKDTGDEFVQTDEGDWVRIDPVDFKNFEENIKEFEKQADGTLKIPLGSILDIIENVEVLGYTEETTSILPIDLPDISPPETLNGTLHPHQLIGYRWLNRLSTRSIGGLLADDMGLGKTVQVITHCLKLKSEKTAKGPHLVILPKTLIENWEREIAIFSNGKLTIYKYEGPHRIFSEDFLNKFDIVLTTYDTLRRDQARLGTVTWDMVVCDEAQYAKNPTTQRTCAVKALKAKHRVALSGTPVENGLIEFWCIMDFVQPGLLRSWADFRKEYEHPIINEENDQREVHVKRLLTEIQGYYLRRMKSDILKDLPQKEIVIYPTVFGDQQYEIYCKIARDGKAGGGKAALGAIQKLRMVCAHPSAVEDFSGGFGQMPCPKLDETINIISEVQGKSEKVIIFTDFKKIQRILRDEIQQKFNILPDIINGELNANRQQVIDIFSEKEGFNVIILGHQVAGVGLNITAANHVIHYTRPWNPAKENQATDRVHRIGQKRSVKVYYPIIFDDRFQTFEKKLDELLKSKEDLARDVLRPSKNMNIKTEELLNCLDI
jgi:hypothetical protein